MDDAKLATPSGEPPLQGLHYARPCANRCLEACARPDTFSDTPPAFFPLKLLVQPVGSVLELTRPDILMGRHSEADVRLPLPDVSRRHCRFLFTEGAWQVVDLHSLNGVFVNGEQVQHAILHDHDLVTIGGFQFEVDLSGRPSIPEDSGDAEAIIHRLSDSLPQTTSDLDEQRRAS